MPHLTSSEGACDRRGGNHAGLGSLHLLEENKKVGALRGLHFSIWGVENRKYLECILHAKLTAPATVVGVGIEHHVVGIVEELIVSVAGISDGRLILGVVGAAVGASPIFVQEVGNVHDVGCDFKRVNVLARTDVDFLCHMEVEMVLEGQVICIAVVVFASMVFQIALCGEPLFEVGTLLVGCVVGRSGKLHLVDLCIGGDEDEVVHGIGVFIGVACIIERVCLSVASLIDDADGCGEHLLAPVVEVIECRRLDAMWQVECCVREFGLVGVAVGVVVFPVSETVFRRPERRTRK